ncbi:MAG: hypothetical protein H0V14_12200 [Chitinophagaceae bacterium]|nr:hypothetical protein [Chitinophagaceae bacterium]
MKLNSKCFALNLKHNKRAANIFSQLLMLVFIGLVSEGIYAQQDSAVFAWPEGKQAAVSLSFDDARMSQVDVGTVCSTSSELKLLLCCSITNHLILI